METLSDAFRANERLLWGLGYRLTGLASDADELVQETFLRALEHPVPDDGRPLRPWLFRVCANLARDRLRARRRRARPGVWLPEPVPTELLEAPEDDAEARYAKAESAGLAYLLALEALPPTQRVVLILRDVFELSAEEVADMLGSNPGAVRVAHHKARRGLAAHDGSKVATDPSAALGALSGFLAAVSTGDAARALELLAPDVELRSDGGGVFHAARMPVRGAEKVLKFLQSVTADQAGYRFALRSLNGLPMVLFEIADPPKGRAPRSVVGVTLDEAGRIAAIHWVLDPTKLGKVPTIPGP